MNQALTYLEGKGVLQLFQKVTTQMYTELPDDPYQVRAFARSQGLARMCPSLHKEWCTPFGTPGRGASAFAAPNTCAAPWTGVVSVSQQPTLPLRSICVFCGQVLLDRLAKVEPGDRL